MKYEPVFGYQNRFNEQNDEMAEVMLWHDCLGPNFVSIKELSRMNSEGSIPHGSVALAMRRIIAEPKRWTVADQEAGRLPDVGAKVDGGKVVFVNGFNVVTELKSGAVIVSSPKTFVNTFKPIETQEEKAQREEDEFVKLMIDLASESQLMSCGFKDGVIAAYRKLK